jgi:hypothetical protein
MGYEVTPSTRKAALNIGLHLYSLRGGCEIMHNLWLMMMRCHGLNYSIFIAYYVL